jgi:hypothetical protein
MARSEYERIQIVNDESGASRLSDEGVLPARIDIEKRDVARISGWGYRSGSPTGSINARVRARGRLRRLALDPEAPRLEDGARHASGSEGTRAARALEVEGDAELPERAERREPAVVVALATARVLAHSDRTMAIATEEYGAKFFANGANPGGVLEHPGVVKDPKRVRESWNAV